MRTRTTLFVLTVLCLLTGCNRSASSDPTPPPLATDFLNLVSTAASSPVPLFPVATSTATPIPPVAQAVCTDPAVGVLLDSLKTAMLSADGELLGSLVSPNSMEVRYYRDGTVITYTPEQAKFLFETTFEADWGADPASGMDKTGSFHDVIVPELVRLFNQPYSLHCNEIRHGGASYNVTWPYDRDFYSIHFAGTEPNGYLDWHTWVAGVEYDNGKPYIYALMQFFWEP